MRVNSGVVGQSEFMSHTQPKHNNISKHDSESLTDVAQQSSGLQVLVYEALSY
jgi:hypothetical protein